MKSMQRSPQAGHAGRRTAGRAQEDHILDPYQTQHKPHEPAACPRCNAVYHSGRWQWGPRPAEAADAVCPACRRIADGFFAGIVTLHGDFARRHKEEMTGLARHEEEAENGEHPLNRIASIEDTEEGVVITTTDIHLPRRLGEALRRAFHGELDMHFDEAGYFVRVDWRPSA
jgi:hypothetical protein